MLDIGGEVRSWQGFETLSVITGLRVEKAAELKLLSDPPHPFRIMELLDWTDLHLKSGGRLQICSISLELSLLFFLPNGTRLDALPC